MYTAKLALPLCISIGLAVFGAYLVAPDNRPHHGKKLCNEICARHLMAYTPYFLVLATLPDWGQNQVLRLVFILTALLAFAFSTISGKRVAKQDAIIRGLHGTGCPANCARSIPPGAFRNIAIRAVVMFLLAAILIFVAGRTS